MTPNAWLLGWFSTGFLISFSRGEITGDLIWFNGDFPTWVTLLSKNGMDCTKASTWPWLALSAACWWLLPNSLQGAALSPASVLWERTVRYDSFIHIITFINSNSKNRNAKNDNYTKEYIYILFGYMYVIYGTEFDHAGFNDPTWVQAGRSLWNALALKLRCSVLNPRQASLRFPELSLTLAKGASEFQHSWDKSCSYQ